ncbi:unnamed protein product [Durusdinium trenchii]|uniref:USP domain-containing protein n=1 Tax=Durusdinium trenchii TaxID=1381693 RepID=A0ABP0HXW6_9DINO
MEIQQLKDMGFGAAEAEVALSQAGNVEQALELLLTTETDSPAPPSPTRTAAGTSGTVLVAPGAADGPVETEWPELPKKKMKPPGLEDQGYNADVSRSNEFALEDNVPTPQMPRPLGLPCGLLNVGNTCYVNSLLQTLFHAETFRNQVLRFESGTDPSRLEGLPPSSFSSLQRL